MSYQWKCDCYESPQEIIDVLPILDKYPLKNIAIHARLGKQLYKGGVDLDGFQNDTTKHKLYYNGDITSVAKFWNARTLSSIDHWMIGRGLISDPFLPSMIKIIRRNIPPTKWNYLVRFMIHCMLFTVNHSQVLHIIIENVSLMGISYVC
jgi:tRNA-dihydrouridine synthase